VTGYDDALVWNVMNAGDFSPLWCNIEESLDNNIKIDSKRMLTNNFSGDSFDIVDENGFSEYSDSLLISKEIS